MSLTSTTATLAVDNHQVTFRVGSTTGMSVPNGSTGQKTYLYIDEEMMGVELVPFSGMVQVTRGINGTRAATHAAGATVQVGLVSDFPGFSTGLTSTYDTNTDLFFPDQFKSSTVAPALSAPVAAAATLAASGTLFHVTGTTATNIITPPATFSDNSITIIADGVWTWTSSAVANGIAATGTVTTAKTSITFTYDAATALWYPSRVA